MIAAPRKSRRELLKSALVPRTPGELKLLELNALRATKHAQASNDSIRRDGLRGQ